ncbi:hypothetical protein PPYR_00742 [Photinus pyralis]|uniref:Protein quiver n=1 Tax=Photinus pyralis TaxID=7054 RepID=A0A1Y1L7N2_PHOPY|nr:uncharacterized protein LOC116159008 [Photinus pyralis]KAB0803772.1 hypothetical protein PPYR_00742 [Photinus pyralis]
MHFKLVLASVGLLCVGVTSGFTKNTCFQCHGSSDMFPQHIDNCRKFINITETSSCSPPGYCIFRVSTRMEYKKEIFGVYRSCSSSNCDSLRKMKGVNTLHCSQCEGNYCNTDSY